MIESYDYTGSDFSAVLQSDGWKIGLLRYSARFASLTGYERHLLTDEVFVLLSGEATLYTDGNRAEVCKMEQNKVYNIPRGVWHHIVVTEDATVLVVENANTSKENTEKKEVAKC